MKTELIWTGSIPEKPSEKCQGVRARVYDICFSPDGNTMLVAGKRIFVYDAHEGELLHALKGHKGLVYSVDFSRNGQRFASGGTDTTVIIWSNKCAGILKYTHTASIQCLAYSPTSQQLASATAVDFGLWSPSQKSVQKFKVSARVCSLAWTTDGQYIALGQFNGHVSIRDSLGNEKVLIRRTEPIWTMSWSLEADHTEVLAVGCWDQTLSFYLLTGEKHGMDRLLDFDPCAMCYYQDNQYLLIAGSNRKVGLYQRDGKFLRLVSEHKDWVWSVKVKPKSNQLAVGANDGTLALFQTDMMTIHGLYQDRYAYRDSMTDVVLQHLVTEQKIRIKTRDYVKKIAVYRSRLAVQLPDRVLVYEAIVDNPLDMNYRHKDRIMKKLECNLLVVTSLHIILCQERKLQLYTFRGKKVREWVLEAVIRYIRVVGGPSSREGLLVGLKNGAVFKVFIDNRFPVLLVTHSAPVRCLDLSASRMKLAVVDENSDVFIYDLKTGRSIYEDANANSVAWNTDMEDMFCYSGNQQLCIKTGNFPIHKQKLPGFVVGFKGSKIFCLQSLNMETIDVPQSVSMHQYLELKDYKRAYEIACLGVTDNDWRTLALDALRGLNFDIARKAFIRIRDVRYIEFLNRIEIARTAPDHDDNLFIADILAFQDKFTEAGQLYCRFGHHRQAFEMFLDLRDWQAAKGIVEQLNNSIQGNNDTGLTDMLKLQSDRLLDAGEFKLASEMLFAAQDYKEAIKIMGERGWHDTLMQKVKDFDPEQHREHLLMAAGYFRKGKRLDYAQEVYEKLNDTRELVMLMVANRQWDEAIALAKSRPELMKEIYLPYAEWLAIQDRFDDARDAFALAGRPDESLKMLEQLTYNAIIENRFVDAGFNYWLLASQHIKLVGESDELMAAQSTKGRRGKNQKGKKNENTTDDGRVRKRLSPEERKFNLKKFKQCYRKASLYYAYGPIYNYCYCHEPFLSTPRETLFQLATWLMQNLPEDGPRPYGISKVCILYVLTRQGKALRTYKLCREVNQKLLRMRMNTSWRDRVNLEHMTLATKPFADNPEFLPVCYRCSAVSPILSADGDKCSTCGQPFFRCFVTFDQLPLLTFELAEGISDDDALTLINADSSSPPPNMGVEKKQVDYSSHQSSVNTMNIDDDDETEMDESEDPFCDLVDSIPQRLDGSFPPTVVNRKLLLQMSPETTFVRRWPGRQATYYRNMIPDLRVVMCNKCQKFYYEEHLAEHMLKTYKCPLCRATVTYPGCVTAQNDVGEETVDEEIPSMY